MSDTTVIEVELLSGRYHAHIWGKSQFGMAGAEWPPSAWRLLRAVAAAWFAAQPRPSSEQERDDLLEALGRTSPPEIWLPKTSFHEIRYYQPVRKDAADRALHHDFFAVPQGGRFWFKFDVCLSESQRTMLATLLGSLRYFGRAESRARLRLSDRTEPPAGVHRAVPRGRGAATADVTYCAVLCPAHDFRASDLWRVRSRAGGVTGTAYPAHLVDVLLHNKMPLPDGARWIEYAVPRAVLVREIRPTAPPRRINPDIPVAEIRFRLNRRIPIPLRLLVAVARAFRDAAVSRHRNLTGTDSLTLSGREADGGIARGHKHAFYLPRLSFGRLTVDTITVRIPTGRLTGAEMEALLGVGRIRIDDSLYPITVVPEEIVAQIDYAVLATSWRSVTPFVPPLRWRHAGGTDVDDQVARLAERVCGHRPASVRRLQVPGAPGNACTLLAHQYFGAEDSPQRRWRLTTRVGFWLELAFDQPVALSIPLGADPHFGAGQLEPSASGAGR